MDADERSLLRCAEKLRNVRKFHRARNAALQAEVDRLRGAIGFHRDEWLQHEADVCSDATLGNPEFDPFGQMNERLWETLEGDGQ